MTDLQYTHYSVVDAERKIFWLCCRHQQDNNIKKNRGPDVSILAESLSKASFVVDMIREWHMI